MCGTSFSGSLNWSDRYDELNFVRLLSVIINPVKERLFAAVHVHLASARCSLQLPESYYLLSLIIV